MLASQRLRRDNYKPGEPYFSLDPRLFHRIKPPAQRQLANSQRCNRPTHFTEIPKLRRLHRPTRVSESAKSPRLDKPPQLGVSLNCRRCKRPLQLRHQIEDTTTLRSASPDSTAPLPPEVVSLGIWAATVAHSGRQLVSYADVRAHQGVFVLSQKLHLGQLIEVIATVAGNSKSLSAFGGSQPDAHGVAIGHADNGRLKRASKRLLVEAGGWDDNKQPQHRGTRGHDLPLSTKPPCT